MVRASCRNAARSFYQVLIGMMIGSLLFTVNAPLANANPNGGTVVAGSANISSSGNTLTVTQNTSRAVINWQGFSIGAGEMTQFVQPSASAAILNRVTGSDPSAILGSMQSNGQVYLINPNGIVFGPNAAVHTGGLIVSTLDVSNSKFMLGGDLKFSGDSTASIHNFGTIRALEGDIYMIASSVANHGVLQASHGTVGLLAGQSVTLVDGARPHLPVTANSKSISKTGVTNTGIVDAVRVELAANGGNVYALAINNSGTVRATGSVEKNGRIYLTAPGSKIENTGDLIAKSGPAGGEVKIDAAAGGAVKVAGKIDAAGDRGGRVQITGDEVQLASATIDASGSIGDGGVVLVGGDYQGANANVHNAKKTIVSADSHIDVDAGLSGDGGYAIVWADGVTDFSGTITGRGGEFGGNGGFAEVSGYQQLLFDGLVDLSAPMGDVGLLLLDPVNVTVGNGGGELSPSTIETAVGLNDVVIHTSGAGADVGKIIIKRAVKYDSPNRLSFIAHDKIEARALILNEGNGTLDLIAGWDGTTGLTGPGMPTSPLANSSETSFFDVDLILSSGAFGASGGNVVLDPKNNKGVSIGTQKGITTTNIAGYNVKVHGGSGDGEFAQIGYFDPANAYESIDNTINVYAMRDVSVKDGSGAGSYAIIGNGAPFYFSEIHGDINVMAGRNVEVEANESFGIAQIGNWAPYVWSNIDVEAGRSIRLNAIGNRSLSLVGHQFDSGEPMLYSAHGESSILAGNIKATAEKNIRVNAGGDLSSAAIGHYAYIAQRESLPCFECSIDFPVFANASEDISSEYPTAIILLGNIETHSYEDTNVLANGGSMARIGHTGHFRAAANFFGNVPVDTFQLQGIGDYGLLDLIGPGVYALGNIDVVAGNSGMSGGSITVRATGRSGTVGQIGHYGSFTGEGIDGPYMYGYGDYDGFGLPEFQGVFLAGNISARAHLFDGSGGRINIFAGGPNVENRQWDNHALIGHKGEYDFTELIFDGFDRDIHIPLAFNDNGRNGLSEDISGAYAIGNISVVADRTVNVGIQESVARVSLRDRAQIGHHVMTRSEAYMLDCFLVGDVDFGLGYQDGDYGHYGDPVSAETATALALGDIKVLALTKNVDVRIAEGMGESISQIGHDAISSTQKVRVRRFGPYTFRIAYTEEGGTSIGDIFVIANRDIKVTNGGYEGSDARIGHGTRAGEDYDALIGDIVGIAGENLILEGSSRHNLAFIGHGDGFLSADHLKGSILLAWDQANSKVDGGGRFFMNDHSEVDSGQRVFDLGHFGKIVKNRENLAIFVGTRREGSQPNVIEDGATINGVRYWQVLEDAGDPVGRLLFPGFSKWGENVEYESWSAEQWGFELWDIVDNPSIEQMLLSCNLDLNFGTLEGTYSEPFTFYYLDETQERFPPIFDWNLFHELPYWPGGVGTGSSQYGDDETNEGDIANDNSNNAFGGGGE